MGRKKTIDDASMRLLLKDYRRPALEAEALSRLFARAEREERAALPLPAPSRRRIPSWAWAPMAAGLVVALGLGTLALLRQGALAAPYSIVRAEGSLPPSSKAGVVEAGDAPLRLRTAAESLVLAAGGRLRVASDPWRRLSGETGNRYYLESGSLYIDHFAGIDEEGFSLVLPWGRIDPLGTILSCRVDLTGADVYCLEGGLRFRDGGKREYLIAAGMVLRIRDSGRRIAVERTGDLDKPFLPDQASAAVVSLAEPRPEARPAESSAMPARAAAPAAIEPRLAKAWSKELGEPPLELYLGREWAVVILKKELLVLGAGDGAAIASLPLSEGAGASGLYGDRLILYGRQELRCLSLPALKALWAVPTGNLAFTSFSIYGDRLFLPSAEGKLYIHALDDGRQAGVIDAGVGLYGRPLVTDGRIVVSSLDRRILAFDAVDYRKLWEYRAAERFVDDRPMALAGLIVDGTREGGLFALDAGTGALLWQTPPGSASIGKPLIWGSRLAYLEGQDARSADAEGRSAELELSPAAELGAGPDGELFAAGPGGIERLGLDGKQERLSSESALMLRSGGGMILTSDSAHRLQAYRIQRR